MITIGIKKDMLAVNRGKIKSKDFYVKCRFIQRQETVRQADIKKLF